ncbi:Dynein heavy chain 5 [Fasciola gigantica]|uniref:Dynein heavy chain 5 n=1 Tax=Fasciola gigantica TaxID=46835 RepID=A0A504YMH1_FASGI|nr:Dynein heavy chain 5 [Fasciola gigantica]
MVPNCKVLFEVDNVDNASPATISRCGMVYWSIAALPWYTIFQAWLQSQPKLAEKSVGQLVETLFPRLLKFVSEELQARISFLEAFYIRQFCDLFTGILDEYAELGQLTNLVVFCLIWSVGCLLDADGRVKFDAYIRRTQPHLDLPSDSGHPSTATVFDYRLDENGNWTPWSSYVERTQLATLSLTNFQNILIPNEYNAAIQFMLNTVSKQGKAILLVGDSGTGKTVMIREFLRRFRPDERTSKVYSFSSATTPAMFQRGLESFIERRVGSTYGPPGGKQLTVFIDDIGMPVTNEWGDQVVNELVRQLMEMGGVYSLDKAGEFLTIMDLQFVAAMGTPGGGREDIPMRLKRQFCIFNTTMPNNSAIDHIFYTLTSSYYKPKNGFTERIISMIHQLVPITRLVWDRTKNKMLPTPTRFHYVFNLRDLSRIWQGMTNINAEVYREKESIFTLWQHEVRRVLSDRLVSTEDKNWFDHNLYWTVEPEFPNDLTDLVKEDAFVVNFMRDPPDDESLEMDAEEEAQNREPPKVYEPVYDIEVLRQRIIHLQDQINVNSVSTPSELVFFRDAICHLTRISRAIRNPVGHILLIGLPGSGKQSLARLSAYIAGYQLFSGLTYGESQLYNFMEDLKTIHQVTGARGTGAVLIFAEDKLRDEACLEYINQILTNGYVPNIFLRDELDEVLTELDELLHCSNPKRSMSHDELYEYYRNQVRANLHVVLSFSPIGENFRRRIMNYPGIMEGCVIDWLQEWPQEALLSVARRFLHDFAPVDEAYVNAVANIHTSLTLTCQEYFVLYRQRVNFTPQTFLTYLEQIKETYKGLHVQLKSNAIRMESGVEKLNEAQKSIDELRLVLSQKDIELAEANAKAEQVLTLVTEQAQIAQQVRNRVQQTNEQCENIVLCINADRVTAKEQLSDAIPALMEAEEALNTLRPHDFVMLRKLQKPPHLIMRVMDCVLLMFYARMEPVRVDHDRGALHCSWNEALRMIHNPSFLTVLLHYPKHRMNEELIDLLEPYINAADYTMATAKKVCGNVAGLLSWTLSMIKYFWVSKTVIPLQDKLAALEQKLAKAKIALQESETMLKEKTLILAKVQLEYEDALQRKMQLQEEADICYNRMCTAHKLIEALSSELTRWTEHAMQLKMQANELGGDCIQLAAFLTYAGAFNQQYRNRLMSSWQLEVVKQNIPHRHKLDVIGLFVDQATINDWALQGLPMDEHSIQNGIITANTIRYPLLMDPQEQGKKWLCKLYSNNVTITSFNNQAFIAELEDALNYGQPILIDHVSEDVDPAINDVISQKFSKKGRVQTVRLGDRETTVIPGFKLFIANHLPNPDFSPELCSQMTVIDFSITMKGLEDQLLARVISVEREKVEKCRIELMSSVATLRRQISQLEENLLQRLTTCEGSLVDDIDLIQVLQDTKNTSQMVEKQLAQAAEAESETEQAREEYRPVAVRGSILFFLMADLSTVNVMYQHGLPQFMKLFDESLTLSEKCTASQDRIHKIIKFMTVAIWRFTVQSIYKKDRLLFTLILAIRIWYQAGTIRRDELDIFIKAGSAYALVDCPPKPGRWIPDVTWTNLKALSKLPVFSGIMSHVTQHERQWKHWFEKDAPEETPVPGPYEGQIRPFTRLLLIRCWCLDRMLSQAKRFISYALGSVFAEDVLLQPEKLYQQADPTTPIVNLLSVGSDPTPLIEQLARKKHLALRVVSMGQGQEVQAKQAIHTAQLDGSWVLLQNCHLCVDYLNELYTNIMESASKMMASRPAYTLLVSEYSTDSLDTDGPATVPAPSTLTQLHANTANDSRDTFRLWITTEEHEKFPINLLQISIKFSNEPPEGIKASLLRTYADVSQDFLDSCIGSEWKSMLYALAFLHCTVQERRKYGPLGWSIPYEFTQADFNATIQFIQNHIDYVEFTKRNVKNSGIDWKCVRYMIAEIQYGGRITDNFDLRLLHTFTRVFFHESMFAPDFELATNYRVARLPTVSQYEQYIQSLPSRDSPEAFHLHANADIDHATRASSYIINCIQNMEPKEGNTTVMSGLRAEEQESTSEVSTTRENIVTQVCNEMLAKLPEPIAPLKIRDRLEAIGPLQPMSIFLRHELDRLNNVLAVVANTLNDLLMVVEGVVVMSHSLNEAMNAIFEARVPSDWLKGFLTGLRQEIARKKPGWALDSVTLINRVTRMSLDELEEYPVDGVYVHGLYLQGAAWDHRNGRLVEPRPKQLYDMLPIVNITAQLQTGPGQFVGGFSTNETPPGKFIFRPVKSKHKKPNALHAPGSGLTVPLVANKSIRAESMRTALSVSESDSSVPRRKGNFDSTQSESVGNKTQFYSDSVMNNVYVAPVYKKQQRTMLHYVTSLKIACTKTADHWTLRGVAVLGDFR